ncbi:unnamed protein product [Medioppia subpectinata]|uniref:Uncharacterized protein n=1 Tax=Medioppia subpectinata TaxID=1979941 RepID=A0A7R9L201_9ACAR|nr:unnamed protein product [Medioppia subpectinata]CAG2114085.1 unnamed protein product [Medioppia subpectinata]
MITISLEDYLKDNAIQIIGAFDGSVGGTHVGSDMEVMVDMVVMADMEVTAVMAAQFRSLSLWLNPMLSRTHTIIDSEAQPYPILALDKDGLKHYLSSGTKGFGKYFMVTGRGTRYRGCAGGHTVLSHLCRTLSARQLVMVDMVVMADMEVMVVMAVDTGVMVDFMDKN